MELQQEVYYVLRTQIQFGVYRFGERLPTIEDAARLFMVSVKTIRAAYRQLQREGYITISKSVGVKVSVSYSGQDSEACIRKFFAGRKDALMDLGQSIQPLFSNAQWLGFKHASPELLDQVEQLSASNESMRPYVMIQQLQAIYGNLGNDMLNRLVWKTLMFFLTPFLSVSGNLNLLNQNQNPLLQMITLCREQNWTALRASVEAFQGQKEIALRQFYENGVRLPASDQQAVFSWSPYKKASQICYSLSMELLVEMSQGVYPTDSLLPSLNTLAREKHISLNTARRAIALLNDIGAAKSVNGVGTKVLPPEQITENCDFSQPSVHKRLLTHVKSVHILTLSCRQVAEATLSSIDQKTAEKWKAGIIICAQQQRHELVPYTIIERISQDSPLATVRMVYTELFRLLLWGYPLRGLLEDRQKYTAVYIPYFQPILDCLERRDVEGFSANLEAMMQHEIRLIVKRLIGLGLEEAAGLVLDE
nr:GntR family transcriptional regulator [Anaerovorax odorimutans]